MAKTYHLKLTGGDTVDISEAEFRVIEEAVYAKRDGMVKAGDVIFSPRDVRRVTSSYEPDIPAFFEEKRPEVSDEQRQSNLRRMRWIRAYIFGKRRATPSLPEDERAGYQTFVEWYEAPERVEKRRLKKQFKAEFYDMFFATSDEMEYCFQSWLPFHDGSRDPRGYKRDDHTPEALGLRDENSLMKDALEVFGASA